MRSQRGFTLVELTISLLISSMLVLLLLGVMSRMSFAFREEQQLTSVQQVLGGVRRTIELDAKQAGYGMAQGFTIANDGVGTGAVKHSPMRIVNSSTGPDEIAFFYADPTRETTVTTSGPATRITITDPELFNAGDLVVLSTVDTTTMFDPITPTLGAKIATYAACVVEIASVSDHDIVFAESGTWGRAGNDHCSPTAANVTTMAHLVAHAWRIDPARPADGVLQLDETGHLLATPSFEDYALGVTDLQIATYFYDADGIDTDDPDSDPDRDWASSTLQDTRTANAAVASSFVAPLVISISIVARTTEAIEGIASTTTPRLTSGPTPDHSPIGDRGAVAVNDQHVYRYTSFAVDLRDLGVGR